MASDPASAVLGPEGCALNRDFRASHAHCFPRSLVSPPVARMSAAAFSSKVANTCPPARRPSKAMSPSAKSPPLSSTARPASTAGRSTRTLRALFDQRAHRGRDLGHTSLISARQHPNEFAQRRQRHGDGFGLKQLLGGDCALGRVVHDGGAHQYVRVSRDSHRSPAHPSRASPVDVFNREGRSPPTVLRQLTNALRLPPGIRPSDFDAARSDRLDDDSLSPGRAPS